MNRVVFSSVSVEWRTPRALYQALEAEVGGFDLDPCPFGGTDGLDIPWTGKVFVNPPYGRKVTQWIEKGYQSGLAGALVVMLLPSRTGTAWWHEYVMRADEVRYIRGRLKFSGHKNSAPFDSVIVIFGRGITPEG